MMKVEVSKHLIVEEMMKAEEPCLRTLSKVPSLTDMAVPLEIAAVIAISLSGGR